MEKSQKSLGWDYKISPNRAKAKNKNWKQSLVPRHRKAWRHTQETRLAGPPSCPHFAHTHTTMVLSPPPGQPRPQKAQQQVRKFFLKEAKTQKEEIPGTESQPSAPLVIHSSTHPDPQIRWGSKTAAAAATLASLLVQQCLGGASAPFAEAAAPRLSPLRIRPSSSRHCFCPEQIDTASARTGTKKGGPSPGMRRF